MDFEQIGSLLIGFLGGGFALAGAIFNWDWFMESGRGNFLVKLIGRNGTRIFYGVIGLFLLAVGFSALFGG
ncbi:MAG: hypothetical protein Phog2KO_18620 [Phototrophicaceae bacterium]